MNRTLPLFVSLVLLAAACAIAAPGGWIELVEKSEYGSYTKFGWNHAGDGYFTIDRATGELTAHGGGGLLWYSRRTFADFELELEFNCDSVNTNSGNFLRVPTVPDSYDYIHHSFEVQIMDRDSYERSRSGLASHRDYKTRQRETVRKRVLGDLVAAKAHSD